MNRLLRPLCMGLIALLLTAALSPLTQGKAFAYSTSSDYAASDFVTNFPNNGPDGLGPMGLAFDPSGNLFVSDWQAGQLYEFGSTGGTASSSTLVGSTNAFGLTFGQDGNLYASTDGPNVEQLDISTGAIIRTVASIPGCAGLGIATDPLSGDLFVSCPGDGGIYRVSISAGTATLYSTACDADGLNFGPDGTLYAACFDYQPRAIAGTNATTPGAVLRTFLIVDTMDGIGVGIPSGSSSSGFLLVNRNDGTITKVDASTNPATLTDIFTGGSRGDFATTGPDGCFYATQTDSIVKVTNADGTCSLLSPTNHAPVVHITTPTQDAVVPAGTVNLSAAFTDQDTADTHTCQVAWGASATPVSGVMTESSGSGTCTSTTSLAAGVYDVTVTVTDNHGASGSDQVEIVVYDPTAGFVTGGGWIDSPAGAYAANPSLTGTANFGFVSQYKKGASVPTGNTQFQFQAGNLDFHSTSYTALVVSGPMAQFRGYGTIHGQNDSYGQPYSFILTARDGAVSGGGGVDGIRVRILDSTGAVVYDNRAAADNGLTTTNVQNLAGGSIVIHK